MNSKPMPQNPDSNGTQVHTHYTVDEQMRQAMAGAMSAAITRTATQPLDVLKIRFQLQVEPVKKVVHLSGGNKLYPKYTSLTQAVGLIYREEGVRAFWKGHNAGQVMSIIYGIMQFWSYEQIHLGLKQMPLLSNHAHMTSFMSGCLAGCSATLVSMPFDVIRTRLVAQDHNIPGGYRNIMSAFPAILKTEGVRGLFRGLLSTMLQIGPLTGANFVFFKTFNNFTRTLLQPEDGVLPTWSLLITGGASGIASKSVLYPLDFIKKRLQLVGFEQQRQSFGRNQSCTGIISCIKLTLRDEGLLGFYKGMSPTLLKSGLTGMMYLSVYVKLRKLLLDKGHIQ